LNTERIQQAITALFDDDRRWAHSGRRLVFWYDAEGSFSDLVPELTLGPVQTLVLGNTPFKAKYTLKVEQPETPYLLYAPFPEPDAVSNWLLDLQMTGVTFQADRAALIFTDLGLSHRPLEKFVRDHLKFFEARKRVDALKALTLPADADQRQLATGLLAVLAGVRVADGALVLRRVLAAGLEESENTVWKEIVRFGAADLFWALAQATVGYAGQPSLRRLLMTLLVAHLEKNLNGSLPEGVTAHQLPNGTRAYALIDAWLRDRADATRLEELTGELEGDLGIDTWSQTAELKVYQGAETFPSLDRAALKHLVKRLSSASTDLSEVLTVAQARRTLHYAPRYAAEYDATVAAAQVFTLRRNFAGGFRLPAAQMLERYAADWHAFDRAYRVFVTASDRAPGDLLKPLAAAVESLYVHWYLDALGEAWSDAFDERLPSSLPANARQWQFFEWHVRPVLEKNDRDRVIVIVSDALRYEVATELRERLVAELRGEAQLGHLLGVLPSKTAWGMTALLPGRTLTWDPVKERVLRDGLPSQGTVARENLLAQAGFASKVLRLDEVLAMTAEQGRAAIEGARVVYVYHDAIDAVGDKPASERDVFRACSDAVEELVRGVKRFANGLNSSTVLVTTDHGFLYQRDLVAEPDKLDAPKGPGVSNDRRSAVGASLPETPGTLSVNLDRYQGMTEPVQAVFPRGSLRFRSSGGGAQYVHGGASLQELVLPVLTYRHKRAEGSTEKASRKVGVQVVAQSRKVTNNRFSVQLVQTEATAERLRARTVTVQMTDPVSGQPVTDARRVELGSASVYPADRTFLVRLSVTLNQPDPQVLYLLTVTDEEDGVELVREPWTISIAFQNDFGDL
jgi:uncharacterized protein (TIGR02687 family)